MGITNLDNVNALTARARVFTSSPSTPATFYGFTAGQDVGYGSQWIGGEIYYNSTDYKLYIQTATSGTTATWQKTSDLMVTTSTSTSTTSSTSTSTSTSSSTSTSTSTSSSTSTTSSSSSTSSTTTA